MKPVRLKACLNGARGSFDHPALPVTPAQLAADARRVVAAGAEAVHLHVKDAEGADTLDSDPLSEVLAAVRRAAPGVPIGVTTGAWSVPDPMQMVAAVLDWADLPDFASVNWHEPGAEEVAAALLSRDVGVEAGLWHAEAVDAWLASENRRRCGRVLLELPDGLDEAAARKEADRLLDMVSTRGPGTPVLLHGEGSSSWPVLRHAGRRGLAARMGLEDTLVMADGSPARDNAALVEAARIVLRDRHIET